MRDRALQALALALSVGVVAVLAAGALDERELAFEAGLPPVRVAAELAPGEEVCRADVYVPAAFDRVRVLAGTPGRPGPELRVRVIDERTGRTLGEGLAARGYAEQEMVVTSVGSVARGGRARVCVRNEGIVPVAIYGAPPDTPPDLLGDSQRDPLPSFAFLRERSTSMLSLLPEAFERSALFKTGWYGPWTTWLLLAIAALAVPAALARALSAAYTSERSNSRSDSRGPAAADRSS